MTSGLKVIPCLPELELAYDKLLTKKVSPREVAQYSQWCRFDPRLGEIWITFLLQQWKTIPPISLNTEILALPWPAAVGVLLEFAKKKGDSVFCAWCEIVLSGVTPVSGEQFFIGLRQLGGVLMLEDAQFGSEEYRRWGYLAREPLLAKEPQVVFSKETRREILKSLLAQSNRIRTRDYWEATGRSQSLRQAERDLKESDLIRCYGKTKSRYYLALKR